jgi:hypothetical protein
MATVPSADPDEVRALWKSLGPSVTAAALCDRIKERGTAAPRGTITRDMLREFAAGRNILDPPILREVHAALLDIQREDDGKIVQFPTPSDGGLNAAVMAPELATRDKAVVEGSESTDQLGASDLSAEYARLARKNAGFEPHIMDGGIDDLRAKAAILAEGDLEAARTIVEAGARLGVDAMERDRLLGVIKQRLGKSVQVVSLRGVWIAAERRAKAERGVSPEQQAAAKVAARALERARLEPLIEHLAKDPKLLDRILDAVARAGVVGERRAIMAVYLTATSRLNRRRCVSLLRRGAPSSGKNAVVDATLRLLPYESVITVSGGSPKSLIYNGGADDADCLKHRLVYLPEAAATLAVKNGVEGEFTAMIRTLISEGYIRYHTVISQDGRPPRGLEVVKNGPIAVIVTSAKNNIEDELMTRLLLADSDESLSQSSKVLTSMLDAAAGSPRSAPPTIGETELFRNFQRWLELGGPYDVALPFASAIRAAFTLTPAATPTAIRARRDLGGLIVAVSASAILHKAQRRTDSEGRIVATLGDYRHAFDAFAPGLAALYRPQVSAGVVRLVTTLEVLIEGERKRIEAECAALLSKDPNALPPPDLTFDGTVRATVRQLLPALGIASYDTVSGRIKEAVAAGVIEIANPGASNRAGNRYRVKVSSATLTAAQGVPVFPTPEMVEAMLCDPIKAAAALSAIAAAEALGQSVPSGSTPSPSPQQSPQSPPVSGGGPQFDENGVELV